MKQESPKDKLLEACGVGVSSKAGPEQERESKKYSEARLAQAQTAPARVPQAQDQTDQVYRRLNSYLRDELPAHLVKAFEKVVQNEVAGCLRPLDDTVQKAAGGIESCAEELAGISWNGRIIWVAVLIGIATVSVGGFIVRYAFFGDRIEEAKRYELYGRKVEANIERYKPKDREKLYRWVGGRP